MVCWRPERSQGMPLHAPGEDEVQVKKIGVSFVSLSRLLLRQHSLSLSLSLLPRRSLQPRSRSNPALAPAAARLHELSPTPSANGSVN